METEIINLLGKRTVIERDENGTTGYTIFTATSLYDSFCVEVKKTNHFELPCDGNKINIYCDDSNHLINSDLWTDISSFLEKNACFVKLFDSDFVETEIYTYACKVIFPKSFKISAQDVVLNFKVSFTAKTADMRNTVQMKQEYNISQCSQV